MANYATLKAAINAVIKTNGNKEITGQVLNQTLMAIVDSLGENYQFAGVAVPSTNPGTPDQNIFYLATQAGTYTNFGATVLPAGISILKWKNNTWSSETFLTIDDAPTAGSDHLVKSGGVKTAIDNVAFSTNEKVKDVGIDSTPTSGSDNLIKSGAVFDAFKNDGGAYDVSVHFPTGGVEGGNTYTLDGAIAMVPQNMQKGGMSIKYVDSSDNKYVQFRYMSSSTAVADFTNVANWQGVDDKPTHGSKNLAESGGIYNCIEQLDATAFGWSSPLSIRNGEIRTMTNDWISSGKCLLLNISNNDTVRIKTELAIRYAFLQNDAQSGLANFADNTTLMHLSSNDDSGELNIPSDANYLYITYEVNSVKNRIKSIFVDGVELNSTSLIGLIRESQGNITRLDQTLVQKTTIANRAIPSNTWIVLDLPIVANKEYRLTVSGGRVANERVIDDSETEIENYDINMIAPATRLFTFNNSGKLKVYAVAVGNLSLVLEQTDTIDYEIGQDKKNIQELSTIQSELVAVTGFPTSVNKNITYIDGYINYYTKTISNSQSYKTSNPIFLNKGELIVAYNSVCVDSILHACIVDSSGNWIRDINHKELYTYYIAEEDCYVAVTLTKSDNSSPQVFSSKVLDNNCDSNAEIQKIKDEELYKKLLNGVIEFSDYSVRYHTALYQDTTINDNYAAVSDFIIAKDINQIKFFVLDLNENETFYFRIFLYDYNRQYVINYSDLAIDTWYNIAFCKYMRLMFWKEESGTKVAITYDDISRLKASVMTSNMVHKYYGEKMSLQPELKWNRIATASYGDRLQDGACYGDILFQFYDQGTESQQFRGVEVFDLAAGNLIQQITLPYVENKHNNAITWGRFYDESDEFPLLYACGLFDCKTEVYRIGGTYGQYTLTKIQTITVDCQYAWANTFTSDGEIYVCVSTGSNTNRIYKFELPLSYSNITLNLNDAIDSFEINFPAVSGGEQGGFIFNNKLYYCWGFNNNRNYLFCVDLLSKKIVSYVRLTEIGLDYEIEGAFRWKNNICAMFNSSRLIVRFDS